VPMKTLAVMLVKFMQVYISSLTLRGESNC